MKPAATDPATTGTVARVAALLRVLAETEGQSTLTDIAARMKLPPSTTHRLLNLLQEQGFVERGQGDRTYRPGMEFLRVGGLVSSRVQLSTIAPTFMRAVVDGCDETCVLSAYLPNSQSATIVAVVYGSHPLRYQATMFEPSSLVWGATGLGILAFLPEEVADAVIARGGPSPATGAALNVDELRQTLARVRNNGYALTRGRKIAGAVGMSAPVFDTNGVVAALCLTLPESRFDNAMEEPFALLLKTQAAQLSTALGGQPAALQPVALAGV